MCALQNHRSRRYNSITLHYGIIHYNGAHAYKHIIMNSAPMHNGIVPYGNIVTNDSFCTLKCAMNNRPILHIHFVPHTNDIHIAAEHRVKPYAAIITHDHITYNGGVWRNETIIPERWIDVINW